MNTEQQEKPKTVKLWSRCDAATLDTATGEITLTDGVNPKFLVQDLVRELQVTQQKVAELTKASERITGVEPGESDGA